MDQRNRDLFRNRSRDTCVDVVTNLTLKEKQGGERGREGEKKETRNDSSTDSFWKLAQAFFLLLFSPLVWRRAASAARRFGSMRAQMGLCLMKFGPSCTCHFRGISDRRPLHRLEHNLRNWREPRSILLDIFDSSLSLSCFRQCEILNASRNLYILDEINDKSEKRKKEKGKEQIPCRDSISLDRWTTLLPDVCSLFQPSDGRVLPVGPDRRKFGRWFNRLPTSVHRDDFNLQSKYSICENVKKGEI